MGARPAAARTSTGRLLAARYDLMAEARARTVAGESPGAAKWDMYWRITSRAAVYVRSPFHFYRGRFVDKSEWDESPGALDGGRARPDLCPATAGLVVFGFDV